MPPLWYPIYDAKSKWVESYALVLTDNVKNTHQKDKILLRMQQETHSVLFIINERTELVTQL